jgi:hypothetical protein
MHRLLLLLFILTQFESAAQTRTGHSIVDNLSRSQVYFIGQLHNNKANTILEEEVLLALNHTYQVKYDVLEYSHSAAFLINQYLETGQDTLLDIINSKANFNFIRKIKAFNDTIADERKIRFYGIDFENRDEGKYTMKAIEIISHHLKLPVNEVLFSHLQDVVNSSPEEMKMTLATLRRYLAENKEKSRLLLGKYFIDVLLITNAQYDFSSNRDEAMIDNFKLLYNELARNGERPAFFGSFGTGHVNPGNKDGIAMRLLNGEDSPVKNEVAIIGIEYVNCQFTRNMVNKKSEGSLKFLCKNAVIRKFPAVKNDGKEDIMFFGRDELSQLNCDKAIDYLAGLIVVKNFSGSAYWTWE